MPKLVRFFTKKFLSFLLALIPVLPPVRGETAAEDKEGSKMPPGFELAFEIPAGDKDAYGNAYHGGTSLSFFLDARGDPDVYPSKPNAAIQHGKEHFIFVDLPGTIDGIFSISSGEITTKSTKDTKDGIRD